jgi:hypothetical protein
MLVHLVNHGFETCNLVPAIMKCAKVHTFILHFVQGWVVVLVGCGHEHIILIFVSLSLSLQIKGHLLAFFLCLPTLI